MLKRFIIRFLRSAIEAVIADALNDARDAVFVEIDEKFVSEPDKIKDLKEGVVILRDRAQVEIFKRIGE